MGTDQILLVERCIGQVEQSGGRFSECFAREIEQVSSISHELAPEAVRIDPLQFLFTARDRLRQLEQPAEPTSPLGSLPDADHFNVTANAMLRALAKTLGPKLDPETRQIWIEALRRIAQSPSRSPARAVA